MLKIACVMVALALSAPAFAGSCGSAKIDAAKTEAGDCSAKMAAGECGGSAKIDAAKKEAKGGGDCAAKLGSGDCGTSGSASKKK